MIDEFSRNQQSATGLISCLFAICNKKLVKRVIRCFSHLTMFFWEHFYFFISFEEVQLASRFLFPWDTVFLFKLASFLSLKFFVIVKEVCPTVSKNGHFSLSPRTAYFLCLSFVFKFCHCLVLVAKNLFNALLFCWRLFLWLQKQNLQILLFIIFCLCLKKPPFTFKILTRLKYWRVRNVQTLS